MGLVWTKIEGKKVKFFAKTGCKYTSEQCKKMILQAQSQ